VTRTSSRSAYAVVRVLHDEIAATFARAGIAEPYTEARDLIAAVCGRPRFWPLVNDGATLDDEAIRRARSAAARRGRGAPFAYAVGRTAFRHFTLAVDDRALIPRQETELLVDLVLEARRTSPGGIAADIGTGCGAIALALAAEGAFDRVIGSDIAVGAIDLARVNAASVGPQIRTPLEFRVGAGLGALGHDTVDVVVSNPPYITFDETRELPSAVRDWEPPHALLCAENGLAVTREIVRSAPAYLHSGGLLALEVDARRASLVAEMVATSVGFRDARIHCDLAGRERFVLAVRS